MRYRTPAGPLVHEHRLIERAVAVLRGEAETIEADGRVDPGRIDALVDFIRSYADRCHHGKEEDILFRSLSEKPLDAPLAEMMQGLIEDHARARELTKRMAEANARYASGEEAALRDVLAPARELVELYPRHIETEDTRFFKPAVEYLTDDERDRMLRDFEEFDQSLFHERYTVLVEGLERAPAHVGLA